MFVDEDDKQHKTEPTYRRGCVEDHLIEGLYGKTNS